MSVIFFPRTGSTQPILQTNVWKIRKINWASSSRATSFKLGEYNIITLRFTNCVKFNFWKSHLPSDYLTNKMASKTLISRIHYLLKSLAAKMKILLDHRVSTATYMRGTTTLWLTFRNSPNSRDYRKITLWHFVKHLFARTSPRCVRDVFAREINCSYWGGLFFADHFQSKLHTRGILPSSKYLRMTDFLLLIT